MKRRDLLKHARAVALGLPAMRASAALQSSTGRDVLVTLSGPFCYWQEKDYVRVMAPPVGTDCKIAPHQAWTGTHANEKKMNSVTVQAPPDYWLKIPGRSAFPLLEGTPTFAYGQGQPTGKMPLFNLWLPLPDKIIGIRPTSVSLGQDQPTYQIFAAGWMCLYQNVEWSQVKVTQGQDSQSFFDPCFTNDEHLHMASLGFFLTPLNQRPDRSHARAQHVWSRMLSMYPWMESEFKRVDFDPYFDPSKCPAAPSGQNSSQPSQPAPAFGPGNDCEVPNMLLIPGGPSKKAVPKAEQDLEKGRRLDVN